MFNYNFSDQSMSGRLKSPLLKMVKFCTEAIDLVTLWSVVQNH